MFRNRRNTCLNYYGKIKFKITNIFHEANACADKLANLKLIVFIHCKEIVSFFYQQKNNKIIKSI